MDLVRSASRSRELSCLIFTIRTIWSPILGYPDGAGDLCQTVLCLCVQLVEPPVLAFCEHPHPTLGHVALFLILLDARRAASELLSNVERSGSALFSSYLCFILFATANILLVLQVSLAGGESGLTSLKPVQHHVLVAMCLSVLFDRSRRLQL